MLKKWIKKKELNREVEKQLIPRLNYLGIFLIIFGFGFLNYAIFSSPYPKQMLFEKNTAGPSIVNVSKEEYPMVPSKERLNFFGVAGVFAAVGCACIFAAWRKKRVLLK